MGGGGEHVYCPDSTVVEHTLLDLSFIQELLGFRQSSKIHCSSRSGLFTQPGLGQIRSWARNVRRMMRQSLIAADPIHSNIYQHPRMLHTSPHPEISNPSQFHPSVYDFFYNFDIIHFIIFDRNILSLWEVKAISLLREVCRCLLWLLRRSKKTNDVKANFEVNHQRKKNLSGWSN